MSVEPLAGRALEFRRNPTLSGEDLREFFEASGLIRPLSDEARLARMARNADITLCAYDGPLLVGLLRALTDYSFCCYVSDLGVRRGYQRQGVGRELLRRLRVDLGDEVMVLLLSAEGARAYYPRVGFEAVDNAFKVPRSR